MLSSGSVRRRGEVDNLIARSMSGCNWLLFVMMGKTVKGPTVLDTSDGCAVCWVSDKSHWTIRASMSSES